MEKLSELKHGLEEAWHSVAEGWRHVRERAAGALTRFTPSSKASSPPADAGEMQLSSTSWALLAGDVFEDDDRVVVRLEVPGMEKQDFEVEVRSDVLVVRGEKRYERESSEGR
jgi:HSP20 family protein